MSNGNEERITATSNETTNLFSALVIGPDWLAQKTLYDLDQTGE